MGITFHSFYFHSSELTETSITYGSIKFPLEEFVCATWSHTHKTGDVFLFPRSHRFFENIFGISTEILQDKLNLDSSHKNFEKLSKKNKKKLKLDQEFIPRFLLILTKFLLLLLQILQKSRGRPYMDFHGNYLRSWHFQHIIFDYVSIYEKSSMTSSMIYPWFIHENLCFSTYRDGKIMIT